MNVETSVVESNVQTIPKDCVESYEEYMAKFFPLLKDEQQETQDPVELGMMLAVESLQRRQVHLSLTGR